MKKMMTNDTNSPMYVSGQMVPPGESVMVDVPDDALPPAEPPAPTLADEVALLLKKPVKELVPALAGLSSDALDMMDVLEGGADSPRSTLLTAIGTEQMRRADEKLQRDGTGAAGDLVTAQNELAAAQAALAAAGTADDHAALEAAVAKCQASVDALTAALPTLE